jgi:hypothetical protein
VARVIALFIALLPALAGAEGPRFSRSGFFLGLQYGPGFFRFSQPDLAAQVGDANASLFISELEGQWNHTGSARLGFDLAGHLSVEGVLTATGWNVMSVDRGGGGFLGGVAAWHPLQLFYGDDRAVDISLFGGGGYGIVGKSRGADGRFLTAGAALDYYFTPGIFLGGFFRYIKPQFDKFYIDYDHRSVPGNTVDLPNTSGGMFWTAGATLGFRVSL